MMQDSSSRTAFHVCTFAYKFTGKERDTESGLDEFGARHYTASGGRWMSPDWSSLPTPIPYGASGMPQSLNLYSYVGNNPLIQVDGSGHAPTYIVDGAEVPSSLVNEESDGVCPDGQCRRVNLNNTPQTYSAFETGGGYYSLSGPGSMHWSADDDGEAAALFYEEESIARKQEPGGYLYIDQNGVYSYQRAIWGPPCNEKGCEVDRSLYTPSPDSTTNIGEYHDHPLWESYHQFEGDLAPAEPGETKFDLPDYIAAPPFGRVFRIAKGADDIGFGKICQLTQPSMNGVNPCR